MIDTKMNNNECVYTTQRNVAIDVLKVIAMIMVLTLHFPLGIDSAFGSAQYNIRALFVSFSYCAVNIYALISGYCLLEKKTSLSRLMNLWVIVIFYSVINLLINAIIFDEFTVKSLILGLLPISTDVFWYATGYIVMYLFIPYINILMQNLGFYNTKKLVFLLLIVFGIGSWVSSRLGGATLGVNSGYTVIWIMILFIVGAAIKKYGVAVVSIFKKERKNIWYLIIAFFCGICVFASEYIFYYVTGWLLSKPQPFKLFYGYCSPFIIVMSISLLVFFSRLDIKSNKYTMIFTFIASFSFGVYIVGSCSSFRRVVWENLFEKFNSYFIVEFLFSVLMTLCICVIIEYVRTKLFKIIKVDNMLNKTEKHIKNFCYTMIGNGK